MRTRLTHSMEVSIIAKQLGSMITNHHTRYLPRDFNVILNDSEREMRLKIVSDIPAVLSCAGLLHDLGNPPFGHFGEIVIRDWFKNAFSQSGFLYKERPVSEVLSAQQRNDLCCFEGNAQALRILAKARYNRYGSDTNLSFAVINTLIKYPTNSNEMNPDSDDVKYHKLGYFYAERNLFQDVCSHTGTALPGGGYARHPLTFLLEAADDIAYATSDLEDALKKEKFTVDQFVQFFEREIAALSRGPDHNQEKIDKSKELIEDLKEKLDALENRDQENDFVTFQKWLDFVRGWLLYVVAFSFSYNYNNIMLGNYKCDLFASGFHEYSIRILKKAMMEFVFDAPEILTLELSAQKILGALLSDFIQAVLYWKAEDETHAPTKAQKKFISLIPQNYKNDYIHTCGTDEAENLYLRFLMVTDFISGMTDTYAKNLYQSLNGVN